MLKISNLSGRRYNFLGMATVALMFAFGGGWAMRVEISGAIIAQGQMSAEYRNQVIQHEEGGVIRRILARDGDRVDAGEVVYVLDAEFIAAELSIYTQQLVELLAKRARLIAERDGLRVVMAPELEERDRDLHTLIDPALTSERKLFQARLESHEAAVAQIEERIRRTEEQLISNRAQVTALDSRMAVVDREMKTMVQLQEKGLVETHRVLLLEREVASMEGEAARIDFASAELHAVTAELEFDVIRLGITRRETAIDLLREIDPQIHNLQQRRIIFQERLSRLEVRAPIAGTIFNAQINNLGAVVAAGAPLAEVVPANQPLEIISRVSISDIEKVHMGQTAVARFSSIDVFPSPEFEARVIGISASSIVEQSNGTVFYEIKLALDDALRDELKALELLPGMPVEVYISTDNRTPFSYFIKPFADYFNQAFRD